MTDELLGFGPRISQIAGQRPEAVAIVFSPRKGDEQVVTWRALDERSTQIARGLAERGVGLGDRLALSLVNSPALVQSVVAAWKLGAVPVPVRWDLPEWERRRVLDVIAAVVELDHGALGWLEATATLPTDPLPAVAAAQTHGICSSGSTGTPKVILIERPARYDAATMLPFPSGWGDIARPQVIGVPAPLYHTNGFSTVLSMLGGDTVVLLEKFDAARLVDLVERWRITTFMGTPTMLQRIADLPGIDDRDLSSLVWVMQGAAVIGDALVRRWLHLVGPERFFMAYGMTEGLGLAAIRGDEWLAHPGSVGRGYRDTEVRIVAPDDPTGPTLPAGELGEIYLRSPTSGTYRYLGSAPPLAESTDGFGTAGDVGYLDDDGFLHIVDRRADLIVTGGANVYPAEVETALIDHPGIADVVVIGLADPEWGRRIHAIVEPADPSAPPTADEVVAWCKARLASYKAPKTVELVEAIPRSEATKVSRAALVVERGG